MLQPNQSLTISQGKVPTECLYSNNVSPVAEFQTATICIANGQIASVDSEPLSSNVLHDTPLFDATGCYVLPGFIDVHVHGAMDSDTMDTGYEALATMSRFFAQHGVTSFLATTMTAPHAAIMGALNSALTFSSTQAHTELGATMLGIHVEGPYISPQYPGAQSPAFIRLPNVDEFAQYLHTGLVRMLTLAPEEPQAQALIELAHQHHVTTVMGHTNATYEQCVTAIEWGVHQATHTYNAMSGLHHRRPGTLGAVLSHDDVYAQLIADNVHVHPAAMNILARCKGRDRTLLITDAMRATGLADGEYDLGGQAVIVTGDECRLVDGTLAGSVLTMDKALKNFMAATGWDLAAAWPVTSRTPARSLNIGHERGDIRVGYVADLVILDTTLDVVATIVGGRVVYCRDDGRKR
ncbi:MAG: N-acetylglucosamine-6-phosphate deacetylase [Chloroflexota bacterium]